MGYIESNVNPILQLERDIVKAEEKCQDLKTEINQLSLDIHVLQMNLTTLKNILKEK